MDETVPELRRQLALAAEAVREAEKRAIAGQLAIEIMHEVRNPVEALGNLIFLARNCAQTSEELERYLRMSEEQLATLSQIVGRTLSLARFSGKPKRTDLAAIIEAGLRVHQRAIDGKKINLVKELSGDFTTKVYATEILQVISNLLVNALDALPENGVLSLRLRKSQGHIHLLIADNGHGIPEEHRDKIFQPFFTTKEERGNGLGLALSREIVERHLGKIRMRSSVRPDKTGTTFRISLPC
ncbi:MAG: HAMP domain-containing sensor histidine kinase [Acidobacteriaceae bacterium]